MKIGLILLMMILLVPIASCQNYAWKSLAWDYDFTAWPDSTIHFIIYHKAETDTGFFAYDTTEANALEWSLLDRRPFYNFTWRSFYGTAIQKNESVVNPGEFLYSFESSPSDTVRAYFRALPPASIGNTIEFKKIKVENIPQL